MSATLPPARELDDLELAGNREVLELVRDRRRRVADLPAGKLPACDRLVARGVLRYFHDGPALWVEVND